jgi:mannose-6-phosphate isomerase-like protein (cupin superfamily)
MSDYTIKNLKDVDDVTADRPEDVEARMSRRAIESQQLGVSYFRYGPGLRSQIGHKHRVQEEAYVVIAGSGRIKLDEEIAELKQWDVVRVAPQVTRAFEAGPEGLELIAVGGPRPEGGDGEMVADWWTD